MPSRKFVDAKRAARSQATKWMCRICLQRVARNTIGQDIAPRQGICSHCLLRYCGPDLASYWTVSWPCTSIACNIGDRRTA
jgi:hypothetical protein